MHRVLGDWDEILGALEASHLKKSPGTIYLYDTEKEYLAHQWQIDLSRRLGFEHHRLSPGDLKSMVPALKLEKAVASLGTRLASPGEPGQGHRDYRGSLYARWRPMDSGPCL